MIALSIFNTCMSNEIDIHTMRIPRIENQRADVLSGIVDIDDWGTNADFFFSFLIVCGDRIRLTRCAKMNNNKLLRFNSLYWNPCCIDVDAYASDW